mmetsp:Transcript_8733/g.24413  ORF Transcript_8733/g.24413 Transcript_8733/m.24413 type:complete len:220 (+) Transcript_8733:2486-3145(+)
MCPHGQVPDKPPCISLGSQAPAPPPHDSCANPASPSRQCACTRCPVCCSRCPSRRQRDRGPWHLTANYRMLHPLVCPCQTLGCHGKQPLTQAPLRTLRATSADPTGRGRPIHDLEFDRLESGSGNSPTDLHQRQCLSRGPQSPSAHRATRHEDSCRSTARPPRSHSPLPESRPSTSGPVMSCRPSTECTSSQGTTHFVQTRWNEWRWCAQLVCQHAPRA